MIAVADRPRADVTRHPATWWAAVVIVSVAVGVVVWIPWLVGVWRIIEWAAS